MSPGRQKRSPQTGRMSALDEVLDAVEVVAMFLAAVLNAYLRPADTAEAQPVIDPGAKEMEIPAGLVLAKVKSNPQGEHSARTPADTRQVRARWQR